MEGLRFKGKLVIGQGVPTFISIWDTTKIKTGSSTNSEIKIPMIGTGTFTVYWGDGATTQVTPETVELKHTYSTPGQYEVRIIGNTDNISFSEAPAEAEKIIEIIQWGGVVPKRGAVFANCSNLNITAVDIPDVSGVTQFDYWFDGCSNLIWNSSVGQWNVMNGLTFIGMFRNCVKFNQNLSTWAMSNATSVQDMFYGASLYNQPFSGWVTSNVVNFSNFIRNCTAYKQDISNLDVSSATDLSGFAQGVNLTRKFYQRVLASWGQQDVNSGLTVNFGSSQYGSLPSITGRQALVSKGWTITDGGSVTLPEDVLVRFDFENDFGNVIWDSGYYGNDGVIDKKGFNTHIPSIYGGLALDTAISNDLTNANRPVFTIATSDSLQSITTAFTVDMFLKKSFVESPYSAPIFNTDGIEGPIPSKGIDIYNLNSSGRVRCSLNYQLTQDTYSAASNSSQFINEINFRRVTVTYDGYVLRVFFDKEIVGSASMPEVIDVQSFADWAFGYKTFDNITIYNRGLTEQEVLDLP